MNTQRFAGQAAEIRRDRLDDAPHRITGLPEVMHGVHAGIDDEDHEQGDEDADHRLP
jgi:hypothetical protein